MPPWEDLTLTLTLTLSLTLTLTLTLTWRSSSSCATVGRRAMPARARLVLEEGGDRSAQMRPARLG